MRQGKESNVRDSWVIIKLADLSKIWASGEEKEKRIENVFEEIMAENFPTSRRKHIEVQEAQRAPNKVTPNSPTPNLRN